MPLFWSDRAWVSVLEGGRNARRGPREVRVLEAVYPVSASRSADVGAHVLEGESAGPVQLLEVASELSHHEQVRGGLSQAVERPG